MFQMLKKLISGFQILDSLGEKKSFPCHTDAL